MSGMAATAQRLLAEGRQARRWMLDVTRLRRHLTLPRPRCDALAEHDALAADLAKARAELATEAAHAKAAQGHWVEAKAEAETAAQWKKRAETAEADLAKARGELEAVRGWVSMSAEEALAVYCAATLDRFGADGERLPVTDGAHSYRAVGHLAIASEATRRERARIVAWLRDCDSVVMSTRTVLALRGETCCEVHESGPHRGSECGRRAVVGSEIRELGEDPIRIVWCAQHAHADELAWLTTPAAAAAALRIASESDS